MKELLLIILIWCVSTISSQEESSNITEQYENGAYSSATLGAQVFASELYGVIAGQSQGNLVTAPLSVAVLLALLRLGTGTSGPSALQLTDALHVGQDAFLLAQGYGELIRRLPNSNDTSDNEVILFLENRIFLQEGFKIEDSFEEVAENDFRSGVQEVDFSGDTQGSQQTINEWVEDSTMGRITNLIPDGSLSSDTRLVLVNAIYFKGSWTNPFYEENTRDDPFHISDSEEVNVPMMHGSFRAQYGTATNADATALILPYRDTEFQIYMVIILPNTVNGLADIEKNIYQIELTYQTREVNISLPKFEFVSSTQLDEGLMELGVTAIFGPQANLRGISDQEDLYVSEILQKAFISVNENGTEAAAATAAVVTTSFIPQPATFTADHPFLFLIRDDANIYFMGRVENPAP